MWARAGCAWWRWRARRKLQAACLTPIEEGMTVRTNTPRLQAHRKLIVELLMAERNHICAVCVANGACELQELARSMGIDHVRLRYRFRAPGGYQPRALRHGSQSLRTVHAVRAGVRRGRGRAHLGRVRARGREHRLSATWARPGVRRRAALAAASACRCAPPGPCSIRARRWRDAQGSRLSEILVTAREKKQWIGKSENRGCPRSGWAAVRDATCRSWTWTSG